MTTAHSKSGSPTPAVPLAVWPVGQLDSSHHPTTSHDATCDDPNAIRSSLARRIIEEYSKPGDLILDAAFDTACATVTTVVAAAGRGCRAIEVVSEPGKAALAEGKLDQALLGERRSLVSVRCGDSQSLPETLDDIIGTVDLICATPHGSGEPGRIPKGRRDGSGGSSTGTTPDPSPSPPQAELAHDDADGATMSDLYAGYFELLRPGGLLVVVTTSARHRARFSDRAGTTVLLARSAGFTYLQHVVALRATIRDGSLIARPSTSQRRAVLAAHRGDPVHLIVHQDVSVFQKPVESEDYYDH